MQIDFSAEMYSDPTMRPHLKKLYESQYAAIHQRLDAMPDEPRAIKMTTPDGQTVEAHELRPALYRAAIPDFDNWLAQQSNFSGAAMAEIGAKGAAYARQQLQYIEQDGPDTSSDVRTVFSKGEQILGYINAHGGLTTHVAGKALQAVEKQADALRLSGEAKAAYLQEHGVHALAPLYGDVTVTHYGRSDMPSKREFAQAWYPDHDVDAAHANALSEAKTTLENMEKLQQQSVARLNAMQTFLLHSMEESQESPVPQTEQENPLMQTVAETTV